MIQELLKYGIFSIAFGVVSTGCMTVRSISANQVPPQSDRRQKISASDSGLVILLVPFGNSFVDSAKERLMTQCPGGSIEGLLTKFQATYVSLIFDRPEVTMEGYCVKAAKNGRA
jgi:hypothetical protein